MSVNQVQRRNMSTLPVMDMTILAGKAQLHHDDGQVSDVGNWWKLRDRRGSRQESIKGRYIDASRAKDFLTRRKYAFNKQDKLDRLAYLCTRAQRSMTSYYGRPVAELRSFCAARGYEVDKGLKKGRLMLLLEGADEETSFPRFMELPPELRVLVYEFSFDVMFHDWRSRNWKKKPFRLAAPPLASVSRLLRKEILPLFYVSGILRMDLDIAGNTWRDRGHYHSATVFFATAPEVVLESVKVLEIVVNYAPWHYLGEVWVLNITLPTTNMPYQISQTIHKGESEFGYDGQWELLDMGARKMLDSMMARSEGGRVVLQRSDIDLIGLIFQPQLVAA